MGKLLPASAHFPSRRQESGAGVRIGAESPERAHERADLRAPPGRARNGGGALQAVGVRGGGGLDKDAP